jgi:predicted amino acid-binding ACT domain protein
MGSSIQISTVMGNDLIGIVEEVSGILSMNVLANDTFAVKFDV